MEHQVGKRPCAGNEGIACDKGNCQKCGWNPKVAKERLDKFLNRNKEETK